MSADDTYFAIGWTTGTTLIGCLVGGPIGCLIGAGAGLASAAALNAVGQAINNTLVEPNTQSTSQKPETTENNTIATQQIINYMNQFMMAQMSMTLITNVMRMMMNSTQSNSLTKVMNEFGQLLALIMLVNLL